MRDYPAWICSACGDRYGSHFARWSTWHTGTCGWCGERTSVTEPRDFGHPPAPTTKEGGARPAPPSPVRSNATKETPDA